MPDRAIELCPRCGIGKVEEVEGWREYGDQLVEIIRLGCFTCGWIEWLEEDWEEEDWERI